MPIYQGETRKTLFKGDYHPAEMYKGEAKITWYDVQTVSGAEISIKNTYNDEFAPTVKGNGAQNETPTPDAPVSPIFSEGKLWSEGRNLLPDTAVFTNSTRDGDVFTFADQLHDRILLKKDWTPKESTDYTIVVDVLENTFDTSMIMSTDERFYFKKSPSKTLLIIDPGMVGKFIVNAKTWDNFDNVTIGAIWLNTSNSVTGTFKAKISILLGIYTADNLPEYQPYRPPVSIELPVLRAIPDGNGGFSARDSLTPVDGMPGWYDLTREVGTVQVTMLSKNDSNKGSYTYYFKAPDEAAGIKMCSHFRYSYNVNSDTKENFFSDLEMKYGKILFFFLIGVVSADNATLTDNSEAMAWLKAQEDAGTPLTVWYPLETPTTERIELGELSTYPYYTHIYSDCEIQPDTEENVKIIGG